MESKKMSIVVAIDNNALMGIKEYGTYSLPWPYLKEDMDFFHCLIQTTKKEDQVNAVIVGYHTWMGLTKKFKTNKKIVIIVISKTWQNDIPMNTEKFVESFDSAVEYANQLENVDNIYVIGGLVVYHSAFLHPQFKTLYLTHIDHSYPMENVVEEKIFFPINHKTLQNLVDEQCFEIDPNIRKGFDVNKNIGYVFKKYTVKDASSFRQKYANLKNLQLSYIRYFYGTTAHLETLDREEYQYLHLVREIMKHGIVKQTRNAITKSIFGYQLRYDLSKGYPLLTVKKTYPKAIFEELMWFVRGQTNVKILQKKGVHIWDKNSSREFLEQNGLLYAEGDIGPGYGFQMRHYGAHYIDCNTDYTGQGIDQLAECISLIRNNPNSRRIIINLWNPSDILKQALPPCHMVYNFAVDLYEKPLEGKRGKLNCHLFQRSWDVFLGWNTSTAALLTYLLAHHCDLDPGTLVHSVTDAHLYQSHIDSGAVAKMLSRIPRKPPILRFLKKHENIEDYQFNDLVLEGYYPCPAINVEMVA